MPRVENRRLGNATVGVHKSNEGGERRIIKRLERTDPDLFSFEMPKDPVESRRCRSIYYPSTQERWMDSVINRCKRASEEGKFRLVGGKTETRGAAVQRRARAEGEGKLSVRINVARRLYRALRIPGNIGNNSNERPPRTC